MHLYLLTRGIKAAVDDFITQLQGKYLEYKMFDDKKNLQKIPVQVAVRPIQLWEIVFPEESKDLMLTTILGAEKGNGEYTGYGGGKSTQHKWHEKFIWGIRKILGAKKIGKFDGKNMLPINRNHVETIGIGLKDDYWTNAKGERVKVNDGNCQEGL